MAPRHGRAQVPSERIERSILLIRGQKVMLDGDLAELYGVESKVLNQAVKRNGGRFRADFLFRLTQEEFGQLRRPIGTSSLRSQIATSRSGQRRGAIKTEGC
jgi:ORF6N domain-containing protein